MIFKLHTKADNGIILENSRNTITLLYTLLYHNTTCVVEGELVEGNYYNIYFKMIGGRCSYHRAINGTYPIKAYLFKV